ncbi:hypothetical protein QE429_000611 [Bacillus sp. SORGH_AS 510]|uniref:hypothetical protein n=1 Tax=Bacillus sp. SORGH_AS_0510 TaxID=3041771 RepID=UPI00278659C0|nr:hypothetical protein [Bacillus sp. SORGH_AS_0510]MDQ1143784.1 hypothetical protein [Bacillus sp. SORGH_AS_0510]
MRLHRWLGAVILLWTLTACAHSSQKAVGDDMNPNLSSTEKEVASQAVSYVKAIQRKDYQKAFGMVSHVYKEAGVTLDDFTTDIEPATSALEGYKISVIGVRDRLPRETSKTNKTEKFYLVSLFFDSKGDTREEYAPYEESGVNWTGEKLWFHWEKGAWMFYGKDDQDGVTWKPDAYEAALTYVQALKNQDAEAISGIYSSFFKQQGETLDDIRDELSQSEGNMVSYTIKEITDDLHIDEEDQVLTPEMVDGLIRVKGSYYKENYEGMDEPEEFKFEWFFHLEDGKWKYLLDDSYEFHNAAIYSFLENGSGAEGETSSQGTDDGQTVDFGKGDWKANNKKVLASDFLTLAGQGQIKGVDVSIGEPIGPALENVMGAPDGMGDAEGGRVLLYKSCHCGLGVDYDYADYPDTPVYTLQLPIQLSYDDVIEALGKPEEEGMSETDSSYTLYYTVGEHTLFVKRSEGAVASAPFDSITLK